MAQRAGEHIQEDYFANIGGINTSDSPFMASPMQAGVGSRNFEYTKKGGFKKRLGYAKYNSVADTQTRTYSVAERLTKDGTSRTIRAAGRKIQDVVLSSATFTNLTEDTSGAGSDFLAASTTVPVATSMFSTSSADVLWLSGGGMDGIYGVYNTTKVTKNGASPATGSIGLTPGGTGGSIAAGDYYYAVTLRKASTQVESNAALDQTVTVTSGQKVTVDLSSLTSLDTTKYDKILIYRSSTGGSEGFTAGALVKTLDSTTTSYVDDGTDEDSSIAVPRANSTSLDNSALPSGNPKYTAVFKRRLATVIDNVIYISDTNKPENWPTINKISLPTGGEVTGLAVVSFSTSTSTGTDEFLCIFKEDALYIVSGTGVVDSNTNLPDWSLIFIDSTGCAAHNTIVNANGYIVWINRQGIYMWDGAGKPLYISRLVEDLFGFDGDLDISNIHLAWGAYFKRQQQIYWQLSHGIYGTQKFALKLDLRLTLPNITSDLSSRILEASFIPDTTAAAMYAGAAFKPSGEATENFVIGDDSGFLYNHFSDPADDNAGIDFYYESLFLDQNSPGVKKDYQKVIVWVDEIGSWDLTLDYWTNYRTTEGARSTNKVRISTATTSATALWDVAYWDTAFWDDARSIKLKPLVFNLSSNKNNSQGDAIKLRFSQIDADSPVTIYGYSILYSPTGVIK